MVIVRRKIQFFRLGDDRSVSRGMEQRTVLFSLSEEALKQLCLPGDVDSESGCRSSERVTARMDGPPQSICHWGWTTTRGFPYHHVRSPIFLHNRSLLFTGGFFRHYFLCGASGRLPIHAVVLHNALEPVTNPLQGGRGPGGKAERPFIRRRYYRYPTCTGVVKKIRRNRE